MAGFPVQGGRSGPAVALGLPKTGFPGGGQGVSLDARLCAGFPCER